MQPAIVGDIGGLGGPGRYGAKTRHNQIKRARRHRLGTLTGFQQRTKALEYPGVWRLLDVQKVAVHRMHVSHTRHDLAKASKQTGMTEGRKGTLAVQFEHDERSLY